MRHGTLSKSRHEARNTVAERRRGEGVEGENARADEQGRLEAGQRDEGGRGEERKESRAG
eukprot:1886523-Rhodomonas_salina.1